MTLDAAYSMWSTRLAAPSLDFEEEWTINGRIARTLPARFSSEPMNETILRASSVRNSRTWFDSGEAFLLGFFIVLVFLSLALRLPLGSGYTNNFSHNERNRQ